MGYAAGMLARDVMTTQVVTVEPETPVEEIARTLLNSRISGVPVLDHDGTLVGIVSEGDLMRRAALGGKQQGSLLAALFSQDPQPGNHAVAGAVTAQDVMTRTVKTIDEDTPLVGVAVILEKRGIKRVPVTRNGVLVGIVSRANLLHGLAASSFTQSKVRDDRRVRSAILERLQTELGIDDRFVNVTVSRGIVHLWGAVKTEAHLESAREIAENTSGVRTVHDHLGLLIPELSP